MIPTQELPAMFQTVSLLDSDHRISSSIVWLAVKA
jgi:hypothetical protein